MDICRNCKTQGENFEQFGTKFHYCSKKCYEESYKLVTTIDGLNEACKTWDKDILVEGSLVPLLIKLKEIPESLRNVYIKFLNMIGFENPYKGNFSEAVKLLEGKLKDDKIKGKLCSCGIVNNCVNNDVSSEAKGELIIILVTFIMLGVVLIIAINKNYDIEVEFDIDKGKPRVRLVLKKPRATTNIAVANS